MCKSAAVWGSFISDQQTLVRVLWEGTKSGWEILLGIEFGKFQKKLCQEEKVF